LHGYWSAFDVSRRGGKQQDQKHWVIETSGNRRSMLWSETVVADPLPEAQAAVGALRRLPPVD
jgi:hypothetical protein